MDKIQEAIDIIAAQCEDKKDVIESLGIIEVYIINTETKMKTLFEDVVTDQKSNKNELQFTAAARACSIVGISIEELMEIEKNVN